MQENNYIKYSKVNLNYSRINPSTLEILLRNTVWNQSRSFLVIILPKKAKTKTKFSKCKNYSFLNAKLYALE